MIFLGAEVRQIVTITLLLCCVIPIGILIIVATILRIKNSNKEIVNEKVIDENQVPMFLEAYGSKDNIEKVIQERSKIIATLKDVTLVNGEKLKDLGAKGVLIVGNEVRAQFGDRASYVYDILTK